MKNIITPTPNYSASARFFDELPLWSAPFGLKLLEFIEYRRGIAALDIGSGAGFPLIEIAMRLGDESIVHSVDPWREALDVARGKIEAYGLSNVQLFEGEAESLPFENSRFDLITSNNGLNNAHDFEKAIAECARTIKPGGQFVQTMNLDKTMFEFYDAFESVLRGEGMTAEIALTREHIRAKRKPVEAVIHTMRDNGFVVRDIEYDEFHYRFADGSAFLNHQFIRMAFLGAWVDLLPTDKVEPIFNEVERRLNETARRNGGLKISVPFALVNATFRS